MSESKMNQKMTSVAAIEHGTVVDHIEAGQGLRVVEILGLSSLKNRMSIGLNLPSSRLGLKDIIKIQDYILSPRDLGRVAILTPRATLNIIENYSCSKKEPIQLPEVIEEVIGCPNERCITNHESCSTAFTITERGRSILLQCRYCETVFSERLVGGAARNL